LNNSFSKIIRESLKVQKILKISISLTLPVGFPIRYSLASFESFSIPYGKVNPYPKK
jgi:hypothetical protein